jgi:prepilin-type processing-associated H-X9-DG protein
MFHDAQDALPPASVHTSISNDRESALLFLLPYLEEANRFVSYNPALGTSDPENAGVIESIIPVYLCPSMVHAAVALEPGPASYASSVGSVHAWFITNHDGAIVSRPTTVRIKDVVDGTSHTFAFGEQDFFEDQQLNDNMVVGPRWAGGYITDSFGTTYGKFNPQTRPDFEESPASQREYAIAFRSDHRGGVQFVMVDGSVQFITDDIEEALLDALATRAGGEVDHSF